MIGNTPIDRVREVLRPVAALANRLRVARELFEGYEYETCAFRSARKDGKDCLEKIAENPELGGEPCYQCQIKAWLAAPSDPAPMPEMGAPEGK